MTIPYEVRPIGYVESPLVDREGASKQGFEGAPDACSSTLPNILAQPFEGSGALARPAWFARTRVTYERRGR
jgi:hypothetical protein